MNAKNRWFRVLLLLLTITLCLLTLTAKRRVIGGLGGFWGPGKTAYREDYTCIGIKFDVPALFVTADGDPSHLCLGILTDRVCTIESVTMDNKVIRTPTACQ